MNTNQNPVRDRHWASSRLPAFLAGKLTIPNSTPIWVGCRIVGEVSNGVFSKKLKGSKHFLHTPGGIAFDIDSLKQAEFAGARIVQVTDIETEIIYRAAISTIWARGFPINRGYGPQIGLGFAHWAKGNELLSDQLTLWGER